MCQKFLQLQPIVCDEKPFPITCFLLQHVISWGKPGKSSIRIGWCMGRAWQWQKDMTRQLMREEAVKGSIWRWWQHHHFPPKFGPRQSHGRQQVAKVDCYLVRPNWGLILWSSSSKSSSSSLSWSLSWSWSVIRAAIGGQQLAKLGICFVHWPTFLFHSPRIEVWYLEHHDHHTPPHHHDHALTCRGSPSRSCRAPCSFLDWAPSRASLRTGKQSLSSLIGKFIGKSLETCVFCNFY